MEFDGCYRKPAEAGWGGDTAIRPTPTAPRVPRTPRAVVARPVCQYARHADASASACRALRYFESSLSVKSRTFASLSA